MKRTNLRNERLVALLLLGLFLFNYPLLKMFNESTLVLGVPKLYLYLFVAWAGMIAGAALILRVTESDGGEEPDRGRARRPMPPL